MWNSVGPPCTCLTTWTERNDPCCCGFRVVPEVQLLRKCQLVLWHHELVFMSENAAAERGGGEREGVGGVSSTCCLRSRVGQVKWQNFLNVVCPPCSKFLSTVFTSDMATLSTELANYMPDRRNFKSYVWDFDLKWSGKEYQSSSEWQAAEGGNEQQTNGLSGVAFR